jgi:DNA-binding NarL/FixJ family response regulator
MRIVLAEDNVLLREGLARLLTEAGFTVVSGVEDPAALLADVGRGHPPAPDPHRRRLARRARDP